MDYYNIDAEKARQSYKRLKGRQVRIVHRHLLKAVDRYMTACLIDDDDDGVNVLALRQLSAIYALLAVKRELQAEGY
jgi:hypothetical protein